MDRQLYYIRLDKTEEGIVMGDYVESIYYWFKKDHQYLGDGING